MCIIPFAYMFADRAHQQPPSETLFILLFIFNENLRVDCVFHIYSLRTTGGTYGEALLNF